MNDCKVILRDLRVPGKVHRLSAPPANIRLGSKSMPRTKRQALSRIGSGEKRKKSFKSLAAGDSESSVERMKDKRLR